MDPHTNAFETIMHLQHYGKGLVVMVMRPHTFSHSQRTYEQGEKLGVGSICK